LINLSGSNRGGGKKLSTVGRELVKCSSPAFLYTPLPLWTTGRVTYRTVAEKFELGDTTLSHVIFQIHVVRNSEYYIYRILVDCTSETGIAAAGVRLSL
jgi:hypothetical protein